MLECEAQYHLRDGVEEKDNYPERVQRHYDSHAGTSRRRRHDASSRAHRRSHLLHDDVIRPTVDLRNDVRRRYRSAAFPHRWMKPSSVRRRPTLLSYWTWNCKSIINKLSLIIIALYATSNKNNVFFNSQPRTYNTRDLKHCYRILANAVSHTKKRNFSFLLC